MANLLGQNIGTNYKGILNLNTLNGNLTTTLQAVTDGDGNSSPLQLSTTGVTINSALIVNNSVEGTTSGRMNIISQYDLAIQTGNSASGIGGLFVGGAGQAASARLHVKGDGTNPIFRLDNNSGTQVASVTNAGLMTANGFQSIAYNESFQRVGFNNGANFNILSYMRSSAAGVIILLDNSEANFSRLHFGGTAKPAVCQGSGTPEGAVTAPIGSIFMRSDGGAGTSFYVKESGTGNTGWVAK